jgi:hypothetical protein
MISHRWQRLKNGSADPVAQRRARVGGLAAGAGWPPRRHEQPLFAVLNRRVVGVADADEAARAFRLSP